MEGKYLRVDPAKKLYIRSRNCLSSLADSKITGHVKFLYAANKFYKSHYTMYLGTRITTLRSA